MTKQATGKKLTRAQRRDEKIAAGKSYLDAEIEIAKEDAAAKIAELTERQKKEDAKVHGLVIEILQTDHPDLWLDLEGQARSLHEEGAKRRKEKAREAAKAGRATATGHEQFNAEDADVAS